MIAEMAAAELKRKAGIRTLAVLLGSLLIGCCMMTMLLTGCEPTVPQQQAAAESIVVPPALDEAFDKAYAAVKERAEDAKLVAIRSSSSFSPGFEPEWMYLFVSRTSVCYYTAFIQDGEPVVADYARVSYSEDEMEAIPPALDIVFDANEAYATVVGTLSPDQIPAACSVYLMMYLSEAEGGNDNALKWFFVFEAMADEGEDADKEASADFAYCVDARTGVCTQAAIETSEDGA